jgi:cytochrome c-type biogenesis protein CcmH/NrfG
MSSRLRRSAAELERAFAAEISRERNLRDSRLRTAERRMRKRERERVHKRGSVRFVLLVLTLIATAVIVTVAMFASLYLLLD